jgi:hypothetical protein
MERAGGDQIGLVEIDKDDALVSWAGRGRMEARDRVGALVPEPFFAQY